MTLPQDPGSIHSTYMAAHSQNDAQCFRKEMVLEMGCYDSS